MKIKMGQFVVSVVISVSVLAFCFYMLISQGRYPELFISLITLILGHWLASAQFKIKEERSEINSDFI